MLITVSISEDDLKYIDELAKQRKVSRYRILKIIIKRGIDKLRTSYDIT